MIVTSLDLLFKVCLLEKRVSHRSNAAMHIIALRCVDKMFNLDKRVCFGCVDAAKEILLGDPAAAAVLLLSTAILAPVLEEVIYRGVLQEGLQVKLPPIQAVIFHQRVNWPH